MRPLANRLASWHAPRCARSAFQTRIPAQWQRAASTKHPKGFSPPTSDELAELKERTREFALRELPEEVAQRTDHQNEFPMEMWQKMGEAGSVS